MRRGTAPSWLKELGSWLAKDRRAYLQVWETPPGFSITPRIAEPICWPRPATRRVRSAADSFAVHIDASMSATVIIRSSGFVGERERPNRS